MKIFICAGAQIEICATNPQNSFGTKTILGYKYARFAMFLTTKKDCGMFFFVETNFNGLYSKVQITSYIHLPALMSRKTQKGVQRYNNTHKKFVQLPKEKDV